MPSVQDFASEYEDDASSFDTWSWSRSTTTSVDHRSKPIAPVRYVRDGEYDPEYNSPEERCRQQQREAQRRRGFLQSAPSDEQSGDFRLSRNGNIVPSPSQSGQASSDPYARIKYFFKQAFDDHSSSAAEMSNYSSPQAEQQPALNLSQMSSGSRAPFGFEGEEDHGASSLLRSGGSHEFEGNYPLNMTNSIVVEPVLPASPVPVSPPPLTKADPGLRSSSGDESSSLNQVMDEPSVELITSDSRSYEDDTMPATIQEEDELESSYSVPIGDVRREEYRAQRGVARSDDLPIREIRREVSQISGVALAAERSLLQSFHLAIDNHSPVEHPSSEFTSSTEEVETSAPAPPQEEQRKTQPRNLTLHDLCSEATTTDDLAWRNALYLLSMDPTLASVVDKSSGWTPLHVCCTMGDDEPPPDYIVRALLWCYPQAASIADDGGRLPLHLLAATSADAALMQLVVQVYPAAVYATEQCGGLTPLAMLLRNTLVAVDLERLRVVLGQTVPRIGSEQRRRIILRQRRGDHLNMSWDEIMSAGGMATKTAIKTHLHGTEDIPLDQYPDDVQACFKKIGVWRRRKRKEEINRHDNESDDSEFQNMELEFLEEDDKHGTKNPAAIPLPLNLFLPIHQAVQRFMSRQHCAKDDGEPAIMTNKSVTKKAADLLRVLIAAYPPGLVAKDAHGRTPLLLALLNRETLPSPEVVEVLLGLRSVGFESCSPPSWADNIPLHNVIRRQEQSSSSSTSLKLNPAMIPTVDSNQLPLHLAAEEMAANKEVVTSIHGCYPGAVHIQDLRGRTPAHNLLRNYQRVKHDPHVLDLLMTDRVAEIRDHEDLAPLDLLLACSSQLPAQEPPLSNVYRRFFLSTTSKRGNCFLVQLGKLPPWLRRHALTSQCVQKQLMEEVSSPGKTALILWNGVVLGTELLCFRFQMDGYTRSLAGTVRNHNTMPFVDFVIVATTLYILCYQLLMWRASSSLSVVFSQVLLNLWTWVDISSALLALTTSFLVRWSSADSETIIALGTATTGILWFSVVGYLAQWWEGMGAFVGGIACISQVLFWPMVVGVILVVAFAQMVDTLRNDECAVVAGYDVCSLNDSYVATYLLLRGTPTVEDGADGHSGNARFMVLVCIFGVLVLACALNLFISLVSKASKLDLHELAMQRYWEPKLTFVTMYYSSLIGSCAPPGWKGPPSSKRVHTKQEEWGIGDTPTDKLQRLWDILLSAFSTTQREKTSYWWFDSAPRMRWLLLCVALILIPLWFFVGLATLGWLWPPCIRKQLFRASRTESSIPERTSRDACSLKGDIASLKLMSFQQTTDLQQEIQEMKNLLFTLVHDA